MNTNHQIEPQIKFNSPTPTTTPPKQTVPWLTETTSGITNPTVRLHNQIIEFYHYLQPGQQEHETRLQILGLVEQQVRDRLGGNASGDLSIRVQAPLLRERLYMRGTEMETYFVVRGNSQEIDWQYKSIEFSTVLALKLSLTIFKASTQTRPSQLTLMAQHQPSRTSLLLHFVIETYLPFLQQIPLSLNDLPELKYLYIILACISRQRGYHTNISSLLLYSLCEYFMINQQRKKQPFKTLSENILKLLQFWGAGIGQDHQRKIKWSQENGWQCQIVTDRGLKLSIGNGVEFCEGVRNLKEFFRVMNNRFRVLSNYYYGEEGVSVLGHLVNPSFDRFLY